jgi:hypothetical protein
MRFQEEEGMRSAGRSLQGLFMGGSVQILGKTMPHSVKFVLLLYILNITCGLYAAGA